MARCRICVVDQTAERLKKTHSLMRGFRGLEETAGAGKGQGERGAGFPLRERLRSPPPSQEQRELVGGCIEAG